MKNYFYVKTFIKISAERSHLVFFYIIFTLLDSIMRWMVLLLLLRVMKLLLLLLRKRLWMTVMKLMIDFMMDRRRWQHAVLCVKVLSRRGSLDQVRRGRWGPLGQVDDPRVPRASTLTILQIAFRVADPDPVILPCSHNK